MTAALTASGLSASAATHATRAESMPPEIPRTTCSKPFLVT